MSRNLNLPLAVMSAAESGFEMASEFIRDVAVLLLIFMPIDFWKGTLTFEKFSWLSLWCFGIFFIGVASQWVSDTVKWAKDIWEKDRIL